MNEDPKLLAQRRFDAAQPPSAARVGELLRSATDTPLIMRTLLDALRPSATSGARIIELGFGPGWLLELMEQEFPECRLHGLDLSATVVCDAAPTHGDHVRLLVGDMERLPFVDDSFDAVVTCWTLYFMRDLDSALAEFRRVLRPGGVFVTATNARDHMHEYTAIASDAVREVLGRQLPPDIDVRFDIDSGGAAVRRVFPGAELREWTGVLRLTTIDDVLALWHTYGDWSVTADEAPAVLAAMRRLSSRRLERDGEIALRRHGGAFIGVSQTRT